MMTVGELIARLEYRLRVGCITLDSEVVAEFAGTDGGGKMTSPIFTMIHNTCSADGQTEVRLIARNTI